MPTDRRTRLSVIPKEARTAAGSEACVMSAGCSIRLSTPPRALGEREKFAALEDLARVVDIAAQHGRDDAAVAAVHLLAFASACCG
jgi:hypothetical protein